MRFKTAAILSLLLIGAFFALPLAVHILLNHYLEQGQVIPFPVRLFFGIAVFCLHARWFLMLPAVVFLFTVAGITRLLRAGRK